MAQGHPTNATVAGLIPLDGIKYFRFLALVNFQDIVTQHAVCRKLSGMSGTECLNTGIPKAGYSKLQNIIYAWQQVVNKITYTT